ncbi:MAG: acyltransferase [Candidatus Thermoplasmatota archaeon]|nr:acyltransferase [Candidatus Thermoplasmatota archaeon]
MTDLPLSGQRVELDDAVAWWPCHIGRDAVIGKGSSIGALAHVGQRVVLGEGCKIQGSAYIADDCRLGDGVFIGPAAVILNDKFPPSNDRGKWQPVHVGDNAVIGGNATVVPGNNVGARAVLAAGAVLTRPLPAGEVWGGNPATFMMTRDEYEARRGAVHDR